MPCYNNGQYVNAAPSYDDDSESLMNLGHALPRNESLEHCICPNGKYEGAAYREIRIIGTCKGYGEYMTGGDSVASEK